jgi:putative membrane protein
VNLIKQLTSSYPGTASAFITVVILFSSALAHSSTSVDIQDFLQNAFVGSKFQMETSKMALNKSTNSSVREFALNIIHEHMRARQTLHKILEQEGISILVPLSIDTTHQKIEDRLSKDRADNFDQDYIAAQLDAHDDAISLFRKYSINGNDQNLKDFAMQELPVLNKYLNIGVAIAQKLSNAAVSNAISSNIMRIEPAAGGDRINAGEDNIQQDNNPNLDHPINYADPIYNTDTPSTANPTEGRSSPSGGPPY